MGRGGSPVSGTAPDLADTVLIQRFLAGDETAFRALYRRHASRLRMTILRLLGTRRGDVDDVLQDAWMAACRALHQFRGDAHFSTWLTSIAIRVARRRLDWSAEKAELDDTTLPGVPGTSTPDAIDLERALENLADAHRAVVVLHDVEGYTHEQIAQHLGIAAGTSRSLLARARRTLRRHLTAETINAR